MQLILNTEGVYLSAKSGSLQVKAGDEVRIVSPKQLTSIAFLENGAISTVAISLAIENNVPIYIFDDYGDVAGCLRSPYFESLALLRRKQVYFGDHAMGSRWVLEQFLLKTETQVEVLIELASTNKPMKEHLLKASKELAEKCSDLAQYHDLLPSEISSSVMGWEGAQARIYWGMLGKSLPQKWQFKARSRRPALDAFNASINYLYAMLYAIVEQALFAAGLDPHLGILHADEYDRPTLAYDLIEPFRPWVDQLVIEYMVSDKAQTDWFETRNEGVFLAQAGKKNLIPAFNEALQQPIRWNGRQMTRVQHIYRHAAELAKTIEDNMQRPK